MSSKLLLVLHVYGILLTWKLNKKECFIPFCYYDPRGIIIKSTTFSQFNIFPFQNFWIRPCTVTNRPDYPNCYINLNIFIRLCEKLERANERSIPPSLTAFTWQKWKGVLKNNSKRPYLTTSERHGRELICNLSERGGTGKLRKQWEQQVLVIIPSIGGNPVVYKVRPEHYPKGNLRILHRNMLMRCDDFLDNYNCKIRQNNQLINP